MINLILTFAATIITGILYFVLGQGYWAVFLLLVITLPTRFNKRYVNTGKLTEIILVFCLLSIGINEFGITYPYSLIFILTGLIVLVFFEGPEWSKLYFSPGETRGSFKLAIIISFVLGLVFISWLYFRKNGLVNPVPLNWPLDALIILGFGYAFFISITEEIIFRSIIFQRIAEVVNPSQAVFFQGFFYGLMWYKIPAISGVQGVILGVLFGVILGFLTKKSNSIYLSMFVHFLVSFIIYNTLIVLGTS